MRFSQLTEAAKTLDFRHNAMPALPFYPGNKPEFIPRESGFYFTFSSGVLMLYSTINAHYDASAMGASKDEMKAVSSLWNKFSGKVDLSTRTITISKEDAGGKSRVRTASHDTLYRQLFAVLRKYGVSDDFLIKGWDKSKMSVGEYLSSEAESTKIKQGKADVVMYHGTSGAAWEAIEKKGLRPGMTDSVYVDLVPGYSEQNLYLTTSLKTAEFYGKRQAKKDGSTSYVILSIKVPDVTKLSPDDSLVGVGSDKKAIRNNHELLKLSIDQDGSAAYKGTILPSHVSLFAKRKM